MTAAVDVNLQGAPFEILGDARARDSWLEMRRQGIGASEVSAILGESPWMSATELYAHKIGAQPDADLDHLEFVYWGQRLEPSIVIGYEDRTRRKVQHSGKLLRSTVHPWAMCTLDAWTDVGGLWQPLEIKNVGMHKASQWEFGPPRHYYLQLQHQMLVTGAQCATIAALIGGQRMVWCDVEADPIEQRRIVHAGRLFWRCVTTKTPPAPDGSDSAKRGLQAIYPEHQEDVIVRLGDDADAEFWELVDIKRQVKELEARRNYIEQRFQAAIGDAQEAHLPSHAVVSWKRQRAHVDWKAYALALGGNEGDAEAHRPERGPRVMRTYEPKEANS